METIKHSGLWSSLCTLGSLVVIWWLCISTCGETRKLTFKAKFDIEGQDQLAPKIIGISTKVFGTFGPHLMILAWTGDELWCTQAFTFKLNLTLKFNVDHPQNSRDLKQGLLQAIDWYTHTDTQTHRQTQAMKIPEGQNWHGVIKLQIENK